MSNAPNDDPEEMRAGYERERERQRRYAEKQVTHLCGALRFFGVEKVTAAFDAYGDEGSIKESVCEPPIQGDLPFGLIEQMDYWWTSFRSTGWGSNFSPNAGLDGVLVLDVVTGKVVEEFEVRQEDDPEGEIE